MDLDSAVDPGFPRLGRQLQSGMQRPNIYHNFAENCVKIKEFGVGARFPSAPTPGSATA